MFHPLHQSCYEFLTSSTKSYFYLVEGHHMSACASTSSSDAQNASAARARRWSCRVRGPQELVRDAAHVAYAECPMCDAFGKPKQLMISQSPATRMRDNMYRRPDCAREFSRSNAEREWGKFVSPCTRGFRCVGRNCREIKMLYNRISGEKSS